ncbi:hypothetical protein C0995_011148 [Termitomyces sp. Mi166|nr:hypothetical protein C0995_011148 [Termitomyces sp. Mi166\
MPEPQRAAAPAARGPAAAGQEEESTFRKFLGIAQQMLFMWALMQLATRFFSSPTEKATTPQSNDLNTPPVDPWTLPPKEASLAWGLGQPLDMHVRLTTAPPAQVFNMPNRLKEQDKGLPSFVWSNITFGDWNAAYTAEFDVKFPKSVLNNGSLWMDVFLTKEGAVPDPRHPNFNPDNMHLVRKLLTPYIAKTKLRKEKKLLGGDDTPAPEVEEPEENITLALISDAAKVPYSSLPAPILEHFYLTPDRDETATKGFYKPIIFPNEFWHLREYYIEINSTTPSLPLQITFQPMSYFKFQMFASLTNGFKEAAKQQGAGAGAELDELKRMLIETNPWFLALTGFVSILHVVPNRQRKLNSVCLRGRFEMLAFSSDVSHWRQKKEMVGVSVRFYLLIITNVFVQAIVLLYLIDNNENTSWMILFGSGMGVLIEAWKITKAVDIKVVSAPAGSSFPYKLEIKDKHVLSEDEKKTQEYDKLAFRYVSYVAIPLLIGYTGYSLVYNTHKGWYSFVISTLTSFVYMFGFAQLVPQLIINYKLKRWIYRVDPKRVNEYGQVMVQDVTTVEERETKKNK